MKRLVVLTSCALIAGCAPPGPSRQQLQAQVVAYQSALAERDQRLAQLTYQSTALARGHAVLTARLQQAREAERLVAQKVEELVGLNERIEARRRAAEQRAAEGERVAAQRDAAELEKTQIRVLRELRESHAARTQAMQELARAVQSLVDSGWLHVSRDDGRATTGAPQTIDVEDPWRFQ
ncbi:MAG TPA: hypothetical protein ENK57_19535 [Polyangiaceae bacterium]|nr:hypothetical protein [Polyangiaceae bacterium]